MSSSLKTLCEDVVSNISPEDNNLPKAIDCRHESVKSVESTLTMSQNSEKLTPNPDELIFFNSGTVEFDEFDSDSSSDFECLLIKPRHFVQFSDSLSDFEEEADTRASVTMSLDAIVSNTFSKTNLFEPPDDIFDLDYQPLARSKSESCITNEYYIPRFGHDDTASGDDFNYFNFPEYHQPDADFLENYYEAVMGDEDESDDYYYVRCSVSMPDILDGSRSRSKKYPKLQRFSHTCSLPDLFFSEEM